MVEPLMFVTNTRLCIIWKFSGLPFLQYSSIKYMLYLSHYSGQLFPPLGTTCVLQSDRRYLVIWPHQYLSKSLSLWRYHILSMFYHMRWASPWHLKSSRSMALSHFKHNYSYTGVMESQKDLQLMDSNFPILQGTKTQRRYVIFFNRCFFKCLPCTVGCKSSKTKISLRKFYSGEGDSK